MWGDLQWRQGPVSCMHSAAPRSARSRGLHSYLWNLSPQGAWPSPVPFLLFLLWLLACGAQGLRHWHWFWGSQKACSASFSGGWSIHCVRNDAVPYRGERLTRFGVKSVLRRLVPGRWENRPTGVQWSHLTRQHTCVQQPPPCWCCLPEAAGHPFPNRSGGGQRGCSSIRDAFLCQLPIQGGQTGEATEPGPEQ